MEIAIGPSRVYHTMHRDGRQSSDYAPGAGVILDDMDCPHCGKSVHEEWILGSRAFTDEEELEGFVLQYMICPNCRKPVVDIQLGYVNIEIVKGVIKIDSINSDEEYQELRIWPQVPLLKSADVSVPQYIAEDFKEAVLVLGYSPKASAALSRRCLQNILVDAAGVTKRDLVEQIEEAVKGHGLNASLRKLLNAVRMVGNYAAHPMKDKSTGVIVDVEPGEAELNISTLEALMDFFYVRPAEEQAKIDAINVKLAAAGKPQIE